VAALAAVTFAPGKICRWICPTANGLAVAGVSTVVADLPKLAPCSA
jgi:hypothetical protein